jgi:serine/threonine protein kinase
MILKSLAIFQDDEAFGGSTVGLVSLKAIARQVADAIGFLHRYDIAQLDVKLDNVCLARPDAVYGIFDGHLDFPNVEIRLVDFGCARFPDDVYDGPIGTAYYASPEMLLGESLIKIKSSNFDCCSNKINICQYRLELVHDL